MSEYILISPQARARSLLSSGSCLEMSIRFALHLVCQIAATWLRPGGGVCVPSYVALSPTPELVGHYQFTITVQPSSFGVWSSVRPEEEHPEVIVIVE